MTATDELMVAVNGVGGTTVLNVSVAAGSDDAEEQDDGDVGLGSSDLELVFDGSEQTIGIRFTGLTIPQGATIIGAFVQFQVDEPSSEDTTLTLYGEAADHAVTFTSSDGDVSLRTRTSASVEWGPPAWNTVGEAGFEQQTPDITSLIQEVVNRGGWLSGNALTIIVTGSGLRVAESYNGESAGAPLLHVEYIE